MTDPGIHTRGALEEWSAPSALLEEIAKQTDLPVGPEARALVDALRERFGSSLAGVLLYGSCLHHGRLTDGLVDLYALVDTYRAAYGGRPPHTKYVLRACNTLLAPNVFYWEDTSCTPPLKAKYAVLSLGHFERGCTRWFHSYLWARFAQPSRLIYSRDQATGVRIRAALGQAVVRFLKETLPACGPEALDAGSIWSTGLALAYASELRTEKNRAALLTEVNGQSFERLTAVAAPALGQLLEPIAGDRYRSRATAAEHRRAHRRWSLRRWQGRALSILRLAKAAFTFDRGADYLAWKIERHTGVKIAVTPALRRFPILFGPKVLWRLLRKGTVR